MFLKQKFSENVLWTVVIQRYFRVLFFSIMWYSKLIVWGKHLLFSVTAGVKVGRRIFSGKLTITSLLWHVLGKVYLCFRASLSYMIYSTPADCIYKHTVPEVFFYFTHRNTEFVIKPLLFLGLWILFFKIILLSVLLKAVLFSLSKLTFQPSKKWRRIWTY